MCVPDGEGVCGFKREVTDKELRESTNCLFCPTKRPQMNPLSLYDEDILMFKRLRSTRTHQRLQPPTLFDIRGRTVNRKSSAEVVG